MSGHGEGGGTGRDRGWFLWPAIHQQKTQGEARGGPSRVRVEVAELK